MFSPLFLNYIIITVINFSNKTINDFCIESNEYGLIITF